MDEPKNIADLISKYAGVIDSNTTIGLWGFKGLLYEFVEEWRAMAPPVNIAPTSVITMQPVQPLQQSYADMSNEQKNALIDEAARADLQRKGYLVEPIIPEAAYQSPGSNVNFRASL